ncbi:transposase, partial [Leptotrichia wadei]
MSYNSNYHSVFDINYHMIFCTKYRREVINDEISNRLKEIFEKICP